MKSLTLIPIGGLANRIFAISSAIAFCQDNQIRLRVIWFKDWGMGANFHSLFELSSKWDNVEIIDAKWYHYLYDRPRKRNLWLPYIWQKLSFEKLLYEREIYMDDIPYFEKLNFSKSLYAVHCSWFYERDDILLDFIPVSDINKRINQKLEQFSSNTIGIHIRRTDHALSIEKSPNSLFIEQIKKEIELDSNAKFYLASDSLEDKKEIKDLFGNKIITSFDQVRRNDEEGIKEAVTELFALSSTRKIYGSFQSTYSRLAARISGIELHILSND